MITSVIGRMFLQAYNKRNNKSYDAKQFFIDIFYPLFFNSNKYLYWVQNSPFVQMKKKQKVDNLTEEERKEKLNDLIAKIKNGAKDASVAIGYPASDEKKFATTSGQVTNMHIPVSEEDVYCSWFGSALGVGVQGGVAIYFYNADILLDVFEGWKLYREALDSYDKYPPNKIMTWNGQWLAHRYDDKDFDASDLMAGFSPFTVKNQEVEIQTVSWTKILICISRCYKDAKLMGYVCGFGQKNTTVGFIPFDLSQISRPVELYKKLFGIDSAKHAEPLWGTATGFVEACQNGVIGLGAMEPKGLRKYIEGKMPKISDKKEQVINFNVNIIWLMAMLNNQDLWDKAREFAAELYKYSSITDRGKTVNSNKVNAVLESCNKFRFMKSITPIISDAVNVEKMVETSSIINSMPSENVPYFLALIKFHYATLNNPKKK